MYKRAILIFVLTCAQIFRVCAAEIVLDTSSQEKVQESFVNMLSALSDDDQQKLSAAMTTIGMMLAQKNGNDERKAAIEFEKTVKGKNAREIIAIAEKMTPHIKPMRSAVVGSDAAMFNRTVGEVMLTLPLHKQRKFTVAIAKIMYDGKEKKRTEEQTRQMLDGMTADEIIAFAKGISSPFPDDDSEITVAPLSDEELKKRNLPVKSDKENSKKATPLSESLVPRE